jgi:DNA invertase Pin-like site-specific DNA recombinase
VATVAEEEGRMISERTKAALAAARRRGVQLGGYNKNPKIAAKARKAGQEANRLKP